MDDKIESASNEATPIEDGDTPEGRFCDALNSLCSDEDIDFEFDEDHIVKLAESAGVTLIFTSNIGGNAEGS